MKQQQHLLPMALQLLWAWVLDGQPQDATGPHAAVCLLISNESANPNLTLDWSYHSVLAQVK